MYTSPSRSRHATSSDKSRGGRHPLIKEVFYREGTSRDVIVRHHICFSRSSRSRSRRFGGTTPDVRHAYGFGKTGHRCQDMRKTLEEAVLENMGPIVPWLIRVIRRSYRLDRKVTTLNPDLKGRIVLRAARSGTTGDSLLPKDAVRKLEVDHLVLGFYSRIFLVPQKSSDDLRMIHNLDRFNEDYLETPPLGADGHGVAGGLVVIQRHVGRLSTRPH